MKARLFLTAWAIGIPGVVAVVLLALPALVAGRNLRLNVSPHMSEPSLFAVVRVRGTAWQSDRPMREQQAWPEHAAFMNGLASSRFIVLGGPLGNGERVLHIVEAESEHAIREHLAHDPWERMGLLRTDCVDSWNVLLDRDAPRQPHAG